ncbi:MAG: xanthine dehydrogenase family protein subunit M [Ignavibacteria bacterium]|nr:xanthine dehydrogenase family protein subunit M [Ignavibacteria bacterium]
MIPKFDYVRPDSLRQAIKQLAASGTRIHAGGTDLLGCLRDRVFTADKVVSIGGLSELGGIKRASDGGLTIGALTTLAQLASDPVILKDYPALAQGALSAASPQLRNQGTLGGNLCQRPRCWYFRGDFHCLRKGGNLCYAVGGRNDYHCIFGGDACYIVHPSDTAPALVALGARVHINGANGSRTIPLESFFVPPGKDITRENVLAPNEILTNVSLPAPAPNQRSSYRKMRARGAWDFALAGVALSLRFGVGGEVEGARVVLSGVAPMPWRVAEAEKALTGKRITEDTARAAAEICIKGAEPMEYNGYKVNLVRALVEEALLALR